MGLSKIHLTNLITLALSNTVSEDLNIPYIQCQFYSLITPKNNFKKCLNLIVYVCKGVFFSKQFC